ncbi:hypothetical protein Y1Q_0023194 [Alligator mississippiensis]|uniref:Uncharacterized protein n=1 Tax=Alligator mississippiensis TaxID=8496 RepID=A0A151MZF3_ALLMI|nr:hypothetical protein Y1Q_0023194 [Alligator mississippiensis]
MVGIWTGRRGSGAPSQPLVIVDMTRYERRYFLEDLACAQAVLEELMPLGSLLFRPEEWDTLKKEHAKTRQERSGVAPARSNTRGENQETPANLHRSDTDELWTYSTKM